METNSNTLNKQISKEEFFKIIEEHEVQQECLDKISKAGLQIFDSDIIEYGNIMFDRVMKAYFTEDGIDWIYWWLYELKSFNDLGPYVFDENGNPISVDTLDDLWNLVQEHRKF